MYKNNSRNSNKLRACKPLQHYYKLKVNCSTVGYYSYANRFGVSFWFYRVQQCNQPEK